MNSARKEKITPEEYLAIERGAEFRSEFYHGEMFAMAGGTWNHSVLAASITGALNARFHGRACQAISENLRVQVAATGLYTYPDVAALCGPPAFADLVRDTLLNPQLIIEVLSDKTEAYDRGAKFRLYRSIPSLTEYVLVSQTESQVERFTREAADSWRLVVFTGLDAVIRFESVSVEVPLAEIYENIDFTTAEEPRGSSYTA